MTFPKLSPERLRARLEPPRGRVRMVLDTDTYNEVDDQFALVYALLSPERLEVEMVYAAPFHNSRSSGPEDGMEKSYDEILRLLKFLGRPSKGFVLRGSRGYLAAADQPQPSPAAEDLVQRAMAGPDDEPLYVVPIGAITNVASAILMEPRIIEKIVVVWLGGTPSYADSAIEFNLRQDPHASRLMLDCGVPFIQIGCTGVASHLQTTIPELEYYLRGKNALCDYLVDIVTGYTSQPFAWSKVIWDVATIAWLLDPSTVPTKLLPAPVLTEDLGGASGGGNSSARRPTCAGTRSSGTSSPKSRPSERRSRCLLDPTCCC